MSKSPIMANDTNHRNDFKQRTLRRVYDALNVPLKIKASKVSKDVMVKGLIPKKGKEEK